MEIVLLILAFPAVVLWECMKMNERSHHRGRRRRRK
nr:MAG TPA: hypothetical protein [Caudoviricetes sp.]